nr:G protein-coupled receptor [Proales similis]
MHRLSRALAKPLISQVAYLRLEIEQKEKKKERDLTMLALWLIVPLSLNACILVSSKAACTAGYQVGVNHDGPGEENIGSIQVDCEFINEPDHYDAILILQEVENYCYNFPQKLFFQALYEGNRPLSRTHSGDIWLYSLSEDCSQRVVLIIASLYGLDGIDSEYKFSWPDKRPYKLELDLFDLYLRSGSERKPAACVRTENATKPEFQPQRKKSINFFKNNIYHRDTCDQIFLNAFIDELSFKEVTNSLVQYNYVGFTESMNAQELRSFVDGYHMSGYRYDFDKRLFPSSVFSRTGKIWLDAVANSFDPEVLKGSRLSLIKLTLVRTAEFLNNNIKWLDFENQRATRKSLRIEVSDINEYNTFNSTIINDEFHRNQQIFRPTNFCIFYRIKSKNLNVRLNGFLIERAAQRTCNCELFWLIENLYKSDPRQTPEIYETFGECDQKRSQLLTDCDFAIITSRCENFTVNHVPSQGAYDMVMDFRFVEFLLEVVLGPLVNLAAFVANLIVILVFGKIKRSSEYRKSKLTDKNRYMWDYVHLNSAFMLAQSLIFTLSILTNCFGRGSIYCPKFFNTHMGHAFYLFVEGYLGNCLRLMSNFTNTMFVLYRYAVNMDRFEKFRKQTPKRVLAHAMVVVLLLSLVRVFVNERYNLKVFSKNLNYVYDLPNFNLIRRFSNDLGKAFYFSNLLLGNAVFTLIALAFDCRLLFNLKKSETRKQQSEMRITKMIVMNGLFSFCFRFPEISVAALHTFYYVDYSRYYPPLFFTGPFSLYALFLTSISQFLFSFSLLENFFTLLLFNQNFSKEAKSLFCRRDVSKDQPAKF